MNSIGWAVSDLDLRQEGSGGGKAITAVDSLNDDEFKEQQSNKVAKSRRTIQNSVAQLRSLSVVRQGTSHEFSYKQCREWKWACLFIHQTGHLSPSAFRWFTWGALCLPTLVLRCSLCLNSWSLLCLCFLGPRREEAWIWNSCSLSTRDAHFTSFLIEAGWFCGLPWLDIISSSRAVLRTYLSLAHCVCWLKLTAL